jgi:tetratricopeptide (TPR) repeat protein
MIVQHSAKPATQDVFISYSRKASTSSAERLKASLESVGITAFMDSSNLELGERFPGALAHSILASRLVVVFVEDLYFQSWCCLRELRTALGPFDLAMRKVPREETELAQSLQPIVLALPDANPRATLDRFPPRLSGVNWPLARDTEQLVRFIRARLDSNKLSIAARLSELQAFELLQSFEEEAAIPPPASIDNIPQYCRGSFGLSLADNFVGRADGLERLHFLLSPGRGAEVTGAARAVQLTAAGGFGKTRAALEYLWRYGPRYYRGGLFWVDASKTEDLEDQFYGISRALQGTRKIPELRTLRNDKVDLKNLLVEALQNLDPARPALCVVDNIPEIDEPRPVRDCFPGLGKVSVLLTGRQSMREPGISVLELDRLPESASVLMLTRDLETSDSISQLEWKEIAEWVGHLPLALELLRWAILDSGVQPKDVLVQARKQSSTTTELDTKAKALRGQVSAEFLRSMTETLKTSYGRLDPTSRTAVQLLAQFAPTPIPEEIVTALGPEIMTPVVRARLKSRHFLTGGNKFTYGSIHRVIRDFIQSVSLRQREKNWNRSCAALFQVLTYERCQRAARDAVVRLCQPHAVELYSEGTKKREPFKGGEQATLAVELGRRAGLLLGNLGRYQEACELLRSVMVSGFYLLNDPQNELWTQLELCLLLEESGKLEAARDELHIHLNFCRQLLGPDHWITLRARLCLGRVLTRLGDVRGGQEIFEGVLQLNDPLAELEEELGIVRGEFQEKRALTLNEVAVNLKNQGELEEAKKILQDVLGYFRRSSGEDSIHTMRTKSNLAEVLREQGNANSLQEARQLQEEIVPALERKRGATHRLTLIARDNLAMTIKALGDVQAARQLQEAIVPALEKALGTGHPDTLAAKERLAVTCSEMGDIDCATDLVEEMFNAKGVTLTGEKKRELREKIRNRGLAEPN